MGRGGWTDHTMISGIPRLDGTSWNLRLRGRELLGGESLELAFPDVVVAANKISDLLSSLLFVFPA